MSARATDPQTSHDALLDIADLPARRRAVLAVLREFGSMNDETLVDVYSECVERGIGNGLPLQSPSGLRTRRCELVRLDMVEDSGERALTRGGRQSIVWRAR